MQRGQSALETLIILGATIALAAVIVVYLTEAASTNAISAKFSECKSAAAQCSVTQLGNNAPCGICTLSCIDYAERDLISMTYDYNTLGAVYLCQKGLINEIYPRNTIDLKINSETPIEPPDQPGYEINKVINTTKNISIGRGFNGGFGGGGGGGGAGGGVGSQPAPQPPAPQPEPPAMNVTPNITENITQNATENITNTTGPAPADTVAPQISLSYSPQSPMQNESINTTITALDEGGISSIGLLFNNTEVSNCLFSGDTATCSGAPPLSCSIVPMGVTCEYHFYSSTASTYSIASYALDRSNNSASSGIQTVIFLPVEQPNSTASNATNETNQSVQTNQTVNPVIAYVFNFSTSSRDTHPGGVAYDNKTLWILGKQRGRIYKYNISGTYFTAYNITGTNRMTTPTNIHLFNNTFYLTESASGKQGVYRVNYTGSYIGLAFSTSAQESSPQALWSKNNYWYIIGGKATVYQYWGNGTFTGNRYNISVQDSLFNGLAWDGNNWWAMGATSGKVYRYDAGFNYTNFSFSVVGGETSPEGLATNGTHFWHAGNSKDIIVRYNSS